MFAWSRASSPLRIGAIFSFTLATAFLTLLPPKRLLSPSRNSNASCSPVLAPLGTAARPSAPQIEIPRHPLWLSSYEGAWSLWGAQAERIPAHCPAACAFVLYARYAHDRTRVAALLDTFQAAELTSPLLPWAEWAFVQHSGHRGRLDAVFPRLVTAHAHLQASLRRPSGLYADPAPDPTSPREAADAVDVSAQMALGAGCLAGSLFRGR